MTWVERLGDPTFRERVLPNLTAADRVAIKRELDRRFALTFPEDWAREYMPDAFPLEFGPHHRWLFGLPKDRPTGLRAFEGAFRGSGKTTTATMGVPLNVIARGSHRFVVIVTHTKDESIQRLALPRNQCKENAKLVTDYPGLAPFGIDHEDQIQLAGGWIVALGAGQSVRGLVRVGPNGQVLRPDLFIFDDLETPEQARSKLRTDRLEEWIFGDVANLGGPMSGPMDMIGIGTTLEPDAVANRALKGKTRFSGWRTIRFPSERTDKNNVRHATWPEGRPLETLDPLITPGNESFIGTHTYAKEYLLDPQDRTDSLVKPGMIHRGRVPDVLEYVALGIDPAATDRDTKSGDYSAAVFTGLEIMKDGMHRVWVMNAWRGWVTMRELFDRVEAWLREPNGLGWIGSAAFEAVGGFGWGIQELRRRDIPHRAVKPVTDKISRFMPVALAYEAGVMRHSEHLAESDFEEEILAFPNGQHDDMADALAYAYLLTTNQGRRVANSMNTAAVLPE